jgi:hypothetical protein
MKIKTIIGICIAVMICGTANAQDPTKENIRLFQSFFQDAYVTPNPYLDAEFDYQYYDTFGMDTDLYQLAFRVGLPIDPKTELHARLGMVHISPDNGSETSLSDLYIGARHMFIDRETKLSGGAFVTIPTGKQETWEDNLDFGVYTALRHPLEHGFVLTATTGLIYTEKYSGFGFRDDFDGRMFGRSSDHKTILRLGGGMIYEHNEKVNLIGEAVYKSRYDYKLISGGIDYAFDRKTSIRGALGLGLDDGAPELQVLLSTFIRF